MMLTDRRRCMGGSSGGGTSVLDTILNDFPELNASNVEALIASYPDLNNYGKSYMRGHSSVFNTTMTCSQDTRVVGVIEPDYGTNVWLFGAMSGSWGSNGYGVRMGTQYRSLYYKTAFVSITNYVYAKSKYEISGGKLYINDSLVATGATGSFSTTATLALFGLKQGSSTLFNSSKVYKFGIYEGTILEKVFVPISTGFIDLVSGSVYSYNGLYGVEN